MVQFFSERNGLVNVANDYSQALRSAVVTSFFNQYPANRTWELYSLLKDVMDLFGIEQWPQVHEEATMRYNKEHIISFFQECDWYKLFDFVEYVLTIDAKIRDSLSEKYNLIFRMHGCPYRIVNYKVIPVVNDMEIGEIKKALNTGVSATD